MDKSGRMVAVTAAAALGGPATFKGASWPGHGPSMAKQRRGDEKNIMITAIHCGSDRS
jgi:hypothetical protein